MSSGPPAKRAGRGSISTVAATKSDHRSDTENTHIESIRPLIPPCLLLEEQPVTDNAHATVLETRQGVEAIISGADTRILAVVGPCSIHDPVAAKEYGTKLVQLAKELADDVLVVMRVYFEKPRTTVGWKGLLNDPGLDGTFKINQGLRTARQLLLDLNEMGLPAGVEWLDTITPQFIADLVSWGAIGARTTESQVHRQLASGLSMPVGFKNGTSGNIQVAADAVMSARHPHCFLSVTQQGLSAIVHTGGNQACHMILRGGSDGPNFSAEHIAASTAKLAKSMAHPAIIVDCSHGNSSKDHTRQPLVAQDIATQLVNGEFTIKGVMIESNLVAGKQSFTPGKQDKADLTYGLSITDACIDFETTEKVLRDLAKAVRKRRQVLGK